VTGQTFAPDLPLERQQGLVGRSLEQHFTGCDDGHSGTEFPNVIDDMGGQDDRDVAPDRGQQIQEAVALGGIEAGGRLIDDDQPRIGQQRLGDTEALFHAARVSGQGLFAGLPQIGLVQQRIHHFLPLAPGRHALEDGQMVQHLGGGHLRIHAELLRQVAEDLPHFIFLGQHVQPVEVDAARVRVLQSGDGAHQRTLARTVRAEQAEHVVADGQR
jgi:hypothetical protein